MILLEPFRWLALILGWPGQLLFFKRKTYYEDRSQQGRIVKGGALIISNHIHAADYMVNVFLFPFRKLHVVLSEMIYRLNKFFYFGMAVFGGIQAERDIKSMSFIDKSVDVLEKGGLVQIFPEAQTSDDKTVLDFKPSYIMIALKSGVPIIPVVTDGNYGIFKRVHVIIGKKIYLSDLCQSPDPTREDIDAMNKAVHAKVCELKDALDMLSSKK